jgi:glycosyltransferase 2 family protein
MSRLLKAMGSLALLALAAALLDLPAILTILQGGSAGAFLGALLLFLVSALLLALRWYVLVAAYRPRAWRSHFGRYFRATFLNTFTPANLGGDLYRYHAYRHHAGTDTPLLALLLGERLLGLVAYAAVLSVSCMLLLAFEPALTGQTRSLMQWSLWVGLALPLALLLAPILRRFPRLPFAEQLAVICAPRRVVLPLMLTLAGLLCWVGSIKVVAVGLGLPASLPQLLAAATLVELGRFIPLTVQGIGLREGLFAYFLSSLGHSAELCYAVAMLAYLALSVGIVLCGPIGVLLQRGEEDKPSG